MFPHKNNIESKIHSNYKGARKTFKRFYDKYYLHWHENNMEIRGVIEKDVYNRVNLLNKYYQRVNKLIDKSPSKKKGWITSQSKFRPTVLEEFCYYLFKDLKGIKKLKLGFFKKNIHAGFRISSGGKIATIKKDVDFCIAREEQGQISDRKIRFIIPVVAIECKTYLDGTMWNESQYTAMLLKRANPLAKAYVLAEANYVDLDKITKESPVNEVFVIKKSRDSKVDSKAVLEFFKQIREDIREINIEKKKAVIGKLINR